LDVFVIGSFGFVLYDVLSLKKEKINQVGFTMYAMKCKFESKSIILIVFNTKSNKKLIRQADISCFCFKIKK